MHNVPSQSIERDDAGAFAQSDTKTISKSQATWSTMQKSLTYVQWLYFIHASTLLKRVEWHEHAYFEDAVTLPNKRKAAQSEKKGGKDNSEQSIVVFSQFTTVTSTSVQILSMERTHAGTN